METYTICGLSLGRDYILGFWPAAGGDHYEFYDEQGTWEEATLILVFSATELVIDEGITLPLP